MSVSTMVIKESIALIESIQSFFRLSIVYFKRNNPILNAYNNLNMTVKNILSANKRLKIARYRVNHYRYRLHQMEQLIEENNRKNSFSGIHINQLR